MLAKGFNGVWVQLRFAGAGSNTLVLRGDLAGEGAAEMLRFPEQPFWPGSMLASPPHLQLGWVRRSRRPFPAGLQPLLQTFPSRAVLQCHFCWGVEQLASSPLISDGEGLGFQEDHS